MHGRVKVRTTAEQEELKKVERAKKVLQYRAGIDLIFNKRKEESLDEEVLLVSEQMVLKNPDIYTLWNIRREAFGFIKWNEEERIEHLKNELTLTEHCLRANPKSYSVWHQRCWVNDNIPVPDWEHELTLCNKCLNLDERNFHCWDYRQHVVRKANFSDEDEFKYSTSKIESNFSNYSSWHYRSLILPKLFPDQSGELPIGEEKHTEELDLVMNATFTDPNDTSAWFYQRWLLAGNSSNSSSSLTERKNLLGIKVSDGRILVAFNKNLSINKSNAEFKVDGRVIDTEFKACNDGRFSTLWIGKLSSDLKLNRKKSLAVQFVHEGNTYELLYRDDYSAWSYENKKSSNKEFNINDKQLSLQLDNYKQLAQIETDNKWALLTGVFIMKKIDPSQYYETILKDLDTLSRIDKMRTRYYSDLRSKYMIDHALEKFRSIGGGFLWNPRIDMSCMDLTALSREQWFGFSEEILLGGNRLGNSLRGIAAFQSCVKLSLSSNGINSLRRFPTTLEKLRFLSLRNNQLDDVDDVVDLVKRLCLTEIDLRDNPVAASADLIEKLKDVSPKLTVYLN